MKPFRSQRIWRGGRDSEGAFDVEGTVDGVEEELCSETAAASVAPVELLAKMLAALTSGV